MKRREFITLLGGAAATWPIAARGQQAVQVIGFLNAGTGKPENDAAFRQGLSDAGFSVDRNVKIEYAQSDGQYDRLAVLAAEFTTRPVDVIAAAPNPAAAAAKAATATIPIVFAVGTDPVEAGLVASLNKPGGNVTGVSFFTVALMSKRIELLHELLPPSTIIGVLLNPASNGPSDRKAAETAAGKLGRSLLVLEARNVGEIDAAFVTLAGAGAKAFVLGNDAFLSSRRDQLKELTIRYRLPAIFPYREYAAIGGLMSYGAIRTEIARQHGVYVGRVLKGEKPADLPVMLPARFEMVVNLKTAKAIGLTIPESFLLRADEVIE
jgi:putative ABC transport system substrate-binding protein